MSIRFPAATLRQRMARNLRGFERRRQLPGGRKPASVAAVVTYEGDEPPVLLLTRRSARLRGHAGQWALPGGRNDLGEDAVEAALRELDEELGVRLAPEAAVGLLDDYPTRSGYLITPVVFWAPGPLAIRPSPHEVESVHRLDLAELDGPDVPHVYRIPESDRPVPSVPVLGQDIPAPTPAVVYQFREVALNGRDTRVDHFEQPVWAWR